jgi:hypothetical protein
VLEAYDPGDVEEVNVVYVGHGGRLPARVRALIDFLVDEVVRRLWGNVKGRQGEAPRSNHGRDRSPGGCVEGKCDLWL